MPKYNYYYQNDFPNKPDMVLVFGSNLEGCHNIHYSKIASKKYGATYGHAIGRVGNSYAIPTHDLRHKLLHIDQIKSNVVDFIKYAENNHKLTFMITKLACSKNEYTPYEVAPLFCTAPINCLFPYDWSFFLEI